ncbi:MAG: OmpA family protein [Myxococcales bacterium]|nr:OmpA family protein [Myxococcales bacterium]
MFPPTPEPHPTAPGTPGSFAPSFEAPPTTISAPPVMAPAVHTSPDAPLYAPPEFPAPSPYAPPYGGSPSQDWAAPGPASGPSHAPSPDSLLGRAAARSKSQGEDPYATETLPAGRLERVRRRGRLGWLLATLGFAALIGGAALANKERERLLALQSQQQDAVDAAQARVAAAESRAAEEARKFATLEAEIAAKDTATSADQKLIADLKEQLTEKDGEIESAGKEVSVSLVDDVMFPSGKAELSLGGYRVLARVGKILKGVEDKQIIIGGHTDNRPVKRSDFPTNWELSSARAVNVVRYLVEEVGLDPTRVSAAAYSQYRPRSKNLARNRRIEVLLTPIVKVDRKAAR